LTGLASDDPLGIDVEERAAPSGPATMLMVRGEVDMDTAERLENAIRQVEGGLVLDLTRVPFMDSTGLRVLLSAVAERGSALSFVLRPGSAVLRLIELAQVADRIRFFETEREALDSIEAADSREP
jgi:stage II sporulation protein AA (anti-sigma F factor antagonist)